MGVDATQRLFYGTLLESTRFLRPGDLDGLDRLPAGLRVSRTLLDYQVAVASSPHHTLDLWHSVLRKARGKCVHLFRVLVRG